MANEVGAEPNAPRVAKRQRHRQNAESDLLRQYYLRNVAIPIMDHLCAELDSQFSEHSKLAVKLLNMLPSVLRRMSNSVTLRSSENFTKVAFTILELLSKSSMVGNGSGNPRKQNIFLRIVPTH